MHGAWFVIAAWEGGVTQAACGGAMENDSLTGGGVWVKGSWGTSRTACVQRGLEKCV